MTKLGPKMPYLSTLRSASLNLSNCKIFQRNKNALFGYFLAGIWKQYGHIWNQQPRRCLFGKIFEKIKMHKFN